MRVEKLDIFDFRNISRMTLFPSQNMNVIYGDNAQGKTNLIEAIWLFSGNSSFRGSHSGEMIKFGKDRAQLSIEFSDSERTQKANIMLATKKKISLNNVELKTMTELKGNFHAVVFSPAQLSMIKDGPKNRRNFIDIAVSAINPQYRTYLLQYDQILQQRNALLKNAHEYKNIDQNMDIWDLHIAKIGTIISIYRNDYVKKLEESAKNIYKELSSKREEFHIEYVSTAFEDIKKIKSYDDENVEIYYKKLKKNFSYDLKQGFTGVGIHRDDLDIYVDEKSVKSYGSQGQQRSCVVALKLAEAELLKKITGENPIMLLDDVMSELDILRQEYLLNHLTDMQVFITCCDLSNTVTLNSGRVIKLKAGEIVAQMDID